RQMKTTQAGRRVQSRVQEHLVNDEPHEQRLDHLQSRDQQRENEQRADGVPMRPEPAQVLAHILTPLAATLAPGFRRGSVLACLRRIAALLLVLGLLRVVESLVLVVLNEATIAMARRARMLLASFDAVAHDFARGFMGAKIRIQVAAGNW